MNPICRTIFCGLMLLPAAAQAEVKLSGEVILGYGKTEGADGEAYGIVSVSASDTITFGSGTELNWKVRARARSDQDDLSGVDDENIDASIDIDFGAAGKLGLSTFNEVGQFPWADGELFNRGSVGVFPVIRKRYDGVADSQFNNAFLKVDPDLLLTYGNKIGPIGIDIVANPLGTWDGSDKNAMLGAVATVEGKLTWGSKYGIFSIAYNDLDDAELQAIFPMRKIGLTLIARYSIEEGDWSDSRTNLIALYRAKNMGAFKGGMLAHARDSNADRTMLGLVFGGKDWEVKIAGDTDGDFAAEGSYSFTENSSLLFGWDNGHGAMQGFDDDAFPAPVFAAPRGSAFEVAYVHKF